ncbi:MAG: LLM class flavin-dependent oxidoreductase, partial [Nitrosopumilus sp.]|nr:LLM class flavin-dependent oxidoreductase [Nitrosopumilus sp.]
MTDLLQFVNESEKGGFTTTMTSDHFHPWWHDNGYGNFTWVWLAAAAERTKNMKFLTGVTAALYRYNPAIIAQAFASLDVLYPGRIGLGIGTGEAMNEVSVGFDWPSAGTRLKRTTEAIQIIMQLWNNKQRQNKSTSNTLDYDNENKEGFLSFNGEYFKTKNARLYTPPSTKIPLYMAASGPKAIQTAAKYTDGLISISTPNNAKETFDIFDKAGIEAGRDLSTLEKIGKPIISYAEDYDKAFASAEFWRATLLENSFDLNINDPRELQKKAKQEVADHTLKKSILMITSIEDLIRPIEEYFESGFTQVYLHSTS